MSALHLPVESNNAYDLFLRYKFQPDNLNHYIIQIKPHWWQTNLFKILTGFIISLSLVLITLYFFKKKEKEKLQKKENERKQAQLELKAIYAQLNPHFIFNALNSIQGLINKMDISNANLYLTEFSSLLRESLKNNDKELIPINIELKTLETYIKLEQLRFHFRYTFSIQDNLPVNMIEVPSLLLQPLVENAIKHGVATLHEKGIIILMFYSQNKDLIIDINDNGKGFQTQTTGTGLGLKLTNERIQLFNQSFRQQLIHISIKSDEINGTAVHLIFKNWL